MRAQDLGLGGDLKNCGKRAAEQGFIWKIATGIRKPVEAEKTTMERGKTVVCGLVIETEEEYPASQVWSELQQVSQE